MILFRVYAILSDKASVRGRLFAREIASEVACVNGS